MKRILLAGATVLALTAAQPTLAADAPVYKGPAPYVAALFNWSGFYVGLNAGYSWGDVTIDYPLGALNTKVQPKSFIGGAQVGYNWQSGSLVFGVEADIAWRNAKSDLTFAFGNGIDFALFSVEQNWVGTLRPRIGIASNNWLFYVTGGLAYGQLRHSFTETRPGTPGANRTATEDVLRATWTIGGGVEVAFNPQLSLGLEYLYMDFGSSTLAFPAQVLGGVIFPVSTASFRDVSQIVRAKLNWRM